MTNHYIRILDPQLSLDGGEITASPSKNAISPDFQGDLASDRLPTTSAQLPSLLPNACKCSAQPHTQTAKRLRPDRRRSSEIRTCHRCGKQRFSLGTFQDEIEAAKAFDAAALRVWGDYAELNFPALQPRRPLPLRSSQSRGDLGCGAFPSPVAIGCGGERGGG